MPMSTLDANQITKTVFDDVHSALQVNVVATTATAASDKVDNATFTPGTSVVTMIGAEFDDVAPSGVTEGNAGAVRMSANRNIYSTIRDASGNERGVNVTATNALVVDASATTQPISAAALPLPTGASTALKQDTGNTSLGSIDGKITACNTGAVTVSTALPAGTNAIGKLALNDGVDVGDVTINNAAGAAAVNIQDGGNSITVDGTVDATQSGTWSVRTQDGSGNALTSHTSGANRALDVLNVGYANVEFVRNDYTGTSVTTAAYTQLIASTASEYHEIHIADTSGQTLKLAVGGAGLEVDKIIIPPGGTYPIKLQIASGSRISIKAVSATASVGEIDIQLLG